jgi:hypothetical protein
VIPDPKLVPHLIELQLCSLAAAPVWQVSVSLKLGEGTPAGLEVRFELHALKLIHSHLWGSNWKSWIIGESSQTFLRPCI